MLNKKPLVLGIIVILLIAMGIYFWKFYRRPAAIIPSAQKIEEPQGLGNKIAEEVQNPAEKIPQTNPYETETNPFEETKTNPFKDVYKNPFQ